MKQAVIIIGLGEMGGVFARGFLKSGYPVYPIGREEDMEELSKSVPDPLLVLLAVGEADLVPALKTLPQKWRAKLALLQNELLPDDWLSENITNPTVISVWFEKKPGQDFKVLIPSPVFGPHAEIIRQALSSLGIPVAIVNNEKQLLFELVRKNLYILTTNICGLQTGGSVKQLWDDNSILMNKVFDDVLEIQQQLTSESFDRDHLLNAVLTAFDGDSEHKCMGRSAPQRLQRALSIASHMGLAVPELNRINKSTIRP
jgi:ketopantoate reductase